MNRSLAVYGIALAVAYGVAYATWTRSDPTELADQEVVILPGELDELESVEYHSKSLDLAISVKNDALGRYLWVQATPKAEPEAAENDEAKGAADAPDPHADPHGDPHADAGEKPPEATPVEPPSEFKAGKAADALMDGLTPFVAKRKLDAVAPEDLAELGFGDEPARLVLHRKGKEAKTFLLGETVYGGASFYVKDPQTSEIFVVDASVIRPLLNATRSLPDTALVDAALKDISRVEVKSGDARATFVQHNPDDPQAQFWSRAGEEEADPAAGAWLDKALRLRSSEYLASTASPPALEEAFSFVVHGKEKPVQVIVYRGFNEEGEEEWFSTSEHTRGFVKLHPSMAAEATADLSSALGAEAPLSPAKPKPPADAGAAAPPSAAPPSAASPSAQVPGGDTTPAAIRHSPPATGAAPAEAKGESAPAGDAPPAAARPAAVGADPALGAPGTPGSGAKPPRAGMAKTPASGAASSDFAPPRAAAKPAEPGPGAG